MHATSIDNAAALPAIISASRAEATLSAAELIAWAAERRATLLSQLRESGAVLLRGFPVADAGVFASFAEAFCGGLSDYVGGNSPRTRILDRVFTTTEYPASEKISLHHEASYLPRVPRLILFCCEIAPTDRGQTPLADSRRVYRRIAASVRARFATKRVRYVNNLHDGNGAIGRSWPAVFDTTDRRSVERRLTADGYQFEWTADGGLRTSIVADGVATHPESGEPVWINQAEQWHPSALPSPVREALSSVLAECDFPHHASFGDGTPFDEAELAHVRDMLASEERTFRWAPRDVLICDNFLVMHGRQPFSGSRRILVSMG